MARKESADLLRALKLLATGKASSISEAARMAGVNRSTIQRARKRRKAEAAQSK